MPREDIITSLSEPSNVSLLTNHLGVRVEVEASLAELVERVRAVACEVNGEWLKKNRTQAVAYEEASLRAGSSSARLGSRGTGLEDPSVLVS
jgi:hypothetical protein